MSVSAFANKLNINFVANVWSSLLGEYLKR